MKYPQLLIAVVLVAGSVLASSQFTNRVEAQQRYQGQRWQYGTLVSAKDVTVFVTGKQQLTINAPMNLGSGATTGGGQTLNGFSGTAIDKVSPGVGAQDMLGADGWEAYATQTGGEKFFIFMRRAY